MTSVGVRMGVWVVGVRVRFRAFFYSTCAKLLEQVRGLIQSVLAIPTMHQAMNSFDFDDFADHVVQEEHVLSADLDDDMVGIIMSNFIHDSLGREGAGTCWSILL